ncbi:MAG: outer membrane protein assembly factor BamC [Pseudomonadota bacterium]|nr:MAG: outer membrane protein assembly factor BamC [Pseudomonadota bacterium]
MHQGFLIKREDPRLGIIETEWAENRADIPQGVIRRWLGKVFDFAYSAPTRDKYRVRMERGAEGNTTEIFLTHWGVKQVVVGGGPLSDPESTVWDSRPSDPELEAEFLNRLVVYLGVGEEQASQRLATAPKEPRARLVSGPGGGNVLDVDERYARAWRLTGIALDHLGFVVEDRDQQQGTYLVRSAEPLTELTQKKGFFANLAFWRDDEQKSLEEVRFRVLLTEAGAGTRVSVNPENEATPSTAQAAEKILALLEEQLR